jgi:NAD(P)H dehydrogenase (quinone)
VRALVVYTHPLPESLTAAARQRAVVGLQSGGYDVEVVDLYATPDGGPPPPCADAIVLVYPTWWGGPPARLLDWLETIATADLRRIRRIAVVTSYGSSRFVNVLEGEPGRKAVEHIRRRCRRGARTRWLALYGVDSADASTRRAFLDRVERRLRRL